MVGSTNGWVSRWGVCPWTTTVPLLQWGAKNLSVYLLGLQLDPFLPAAQGPDQTPNHPLAQPCLESKCSIIQMHSTALIAFRTKSPEVNIGDYEPIECWSCKSWRLLSFCQENLLIVEFFLSGMFRHDTTTMKLATAVCSSTSFLAPNPTWAKWVASRWYLLDIPSDHNICLIYSSSSQ